MMTLIMIMDVATSAPSSN